MTFIDYGKHIKSTTPVGKVAGGMAVAAFIHEKTNQHYTIFVNFKGKQAFLDIANDDTEGKVTSHLVNRSDLLGELLDKKLQFG